MRLTLDCIVVCLAFIMKSTSILNIYNGILYVHRALITTLIQWMVFYILYTQGLFIWDAVQLFSVEMRWRGYAYCKRINLFNFAASIAIVLSFKLDKIQTHKLVL